MRPEQPHDQAPPTPPVLGPPPPPAAPPPGSPSSPWPVVAAVFVGLWAVGVTLPAQVVTWLVDQVLLAGGLDQPGWLWPVVGVVNAALVALPAALLATIPRSPAVRAAGRGWLIAAVLLGVLSSLRAIPIVQHELYLATFALVCGLAAGLIRWRSAGRPDRSDPLAALFAVAAGTAVLLPWLWLGALGGLLETVLVIAAAAAVGWLSAAVLDPLWPAYAATPMRLVLVGGLVAGVALLLLATGTGQSGAHLATMLPLPAAGFAAAALHPLARRIPHKTASYGPSRPVRSAATGWLVGLAVAGPLGFADPEEITLLLAISRDVPFWTAVAAVGSLTVALLVGVGYGIGFGRRRAPVPRRWVGAVTAVVVLFAAGGVYFGLGQPGLHGEKLFVLLKARADLSGIGTASGPEARNDRVREVYRRLVETADRTQTGLRRDLDRWGVDYTPYYLVNAIEVDGGPVLRAWLTRRADVDRVLLSQQLRPLPAKVSPMTGKAAAPSTPPWNLTMIGADRVWSELGIDGSGIVVGGSDSGVDGRHPALANGFRGGDDSWYDPWNGTRTPTDNAGHGTHTLGTAVGGQQIGVAPGARWVACVNLDRNLGNPAAYLDCLQFMLAPFPPDGDPFTDGRPERAPHVLTNSWGCPAIEGCDEASLQPAVEALAAAGIFMAVAAGNTGPFCGSVDDPPAPYAEVLTVGAVDRSRRVTQFSSRGPASDGLTKPDVVAPGADVLSAMPGGGYTTQDGTSMATPHVAGVVALMWSANPSLVGDLERTRQILRQTATAAEPSYLSQAETDRCGGDANIVGAGLVDAYAAVAAAQAAGG